MFDDSNKINYQLKTKVKFLILSIDKRQNGHLTD